MDIPKEYQGCPGIPTSYFENHQFKGITGNKRKINHKQNKPEILKNAYTPGSTHSTELSPGERARLDAQHKERHGRVRGCTVKTHSHRPLHLNSTPSQTSL